MRFRCCWSGLPRVCLGVFALAFTTPAFAVSWTELLDAAVKHSPEVAVLQAKAAEIAVQRDNAQAWWQEAPTASVSHRSDQWQTDRGAREWEVELAAPLLHGQQREAQQHAADAAEQARLAQVDLVKWTLAGELQQRVWECVERDLMLRLAEQRVDVVGRLTADVRRRVLAGELAEADALLAQSEWLAAQNQRDDALLLRDEAHQQLWVLTGSDLLPDAIDLSKPLQTKMPENKVQQDVFLQHPRWLASQSSQALAVAELASARQGGAPISAGVSWLQARDEADAQDRRLVGLTMSLPLGRDPRQRSAVANANAAVTAAMSESEKTRREILATLQQAIRAENNARRQVLQAEQQAVAAETSLGLSRRAFDAGELDLASILRVQQTAQEANQQRELKKTGLARAQAALKLAWGQLP